MTDFVAEVSSNHHTDIERCRAFIARAAAVGCAAVKFQLFTVDQLFAPEIVAASPEHRARRAWELPRDMVPELAACARTHDIGFACTPFDLPAVDVLAPHVDFLKVASYELLWDDLLRACAATGRPVVLSTGMATMAEIAHAVEVLRTANASAVTVLHCVSGYPTPKTDANLSAIATLRDAFDVPVGWSDHSRDPGVVLRAVHRWQASMVEFHLDLEGDGPEYAAGHCWLPDEIAPVIAACADLSVADGDGVKAPQAAERSDRDWRADPSDGLRPLKALRPGFRQAG